VVQTLTGAAISPQVARETWLPTSRIGPKPPRPAISKAPPTFA